MNQTQLTDFAARYASAWSSQNPDRLTAFYAESGSLQVNAGPPAIGRAAVRATAQGCEWIPGHDRANGFCRPSGSHGGLPLDVDGDEHGARWDGQGRAHQRIRGMDL